MKALLKRKFSHSKKSASSTNTTANGTSSNTNTNAGTSDRKPPFEEIPEHPQVVLRQQEEPREQSGKSSGAREGAQQDMKGELREQEPRQHQPEAVSVPIDKPEYPLKQGLNPTPRGRNNSNVPRELSSDSEDDNIHEPHTGRNKSNKKNGKGGGVVTSGGSGGSNLNSHGEEDREGLERRLQTTREMRKELGGAGGGVACDLSALELHSFPEEAHKCCFEEGVKELLLHHNLLKKIDHPICTLAMLRALDLQNNRIDRFPKDIVKLTNLRSLNLNNNCIQKLPDVIGELLHLETLRIKGNKLVKISKKIGCLQRLTHMDIGCNFLKSLPNELALIPNLVTMSIEGNPLPKSLMDSYYANGSEGVLSELSRSGGYGARTVTLSGGQEVGQISATDGASASDLSGGGGQTISTKAQNQEQRHQPLLAEANYDNFLLNANADLDVMGNAGQSGDERSGSDSNKENETMDLNARTNTDIAAANGIYHEKNREEKPRTKKGAPIKVKMKRDLYKELLNREIQECEFPVEGCLFAESKLQVLEDKITEMTELCLTSETGNFREKMKDILMETQSLVHNFETIENDAHQQIAESSQKMRMAQQQIELLDAIDRQRKGATIQLYKTLLHHQKFELESRLQEVIYHEEKHNAKQQYFKEINLGKTTPGYIADNRWNRELQRVLEKSQAYQAHPEKEPPLTAIETERLKFAQRELANVKNPSGMGLIATEPSSLAACLAQMEQDMPAPSSTI
eukprot:Nk52_evm17s578 gene=Nk52_evmTU17s578